MSAPTLLHTLFGYHAWANDELLTKMQGFDPERHQEERHAAMRLMNHCSVVNRIFIAHLSGTRHGFTADNTPETPALDELHTTITATDRWYLDYLEAVTPAELSEPVPLVFTDGDKGCMTREEMLTHVATHGGYHRGEVGRIMARLSLPLPWDTFAVYLHRTQPQRRLKE